MDERLASPLSALKGAGPRRAALLEKLGLLTIYDLLWFFPRKYEDRRNVRKISELVPGAPAVVEAESRGCEARTLPGRGRRLIKCRFSDGGGFLDAVWFNIKGLENSLKEGTRAALFGVPSLRGGVFEMLSPEFEILKGGEILDGFKGIAPVYPLTAGLPKNWLRRTVTETVKKYSPLLSDPIPLKIREKNNLMPLPEAVRQMHEPDSPPAWKDARRRIAYGELFELQLEMAASREKNAKSGAAAAERGPLYRAMTKNLPFEFTGSQKKVIDEIIDGASTGAQSARLVQGDVGSGKTAVAAAFAAAVCDGGAQCAVLAPTESLAEQLYERMKKYIPLGEDECVLLKGSMPAAARRKAEAAIASGEVRIAAGTQALLSEKIKFRELGAVIIDEQQRFGVRQREKLLSGSSKPHLLMLSATPIPRTMALTLYGDLDVSVIESVPAGRAPVETRTTGYAGLTELLRFIAREIMACGRVYWICPRVEESEGSPVSAVKRYEWLVKKLPPVKISLVHGQMESAEKERALSSFRSGASQLLVGTTVLEVGIDVPEATVIVIESPERYGLSQLHQLRGRVGRGTRRGVCILLSDAAEDAERLKKFAATNDGFAIARADLETRGAGELTGIAQHGSAGLKVADLARDAGLAALAREDVLSLAARGLTAETLSACRASSLRRNGPQSS